MELVFETTPVSELPDSPASDYAVWSTPLLYSKSKASTPAKPHVALISIDALRADHLSCYGYARHTSPNIDRLAEDGVLFLNTYSSAPWTIPARASILTGKLPHKYGATRDSADTWTWFPLRESQTTLAEILRQHGYLTAAFTGGGYMGAKTGLHQGFDVYFDNGVPDWEPFFDIERSLGKVDAFLEQHRHIPCFLFFHTFEVHTPYTRSRFVRGKKRGRLGEQIRFHGASSSRESIETATEQEKEYILARYDSDIYYTDEHIGKLLETLKRLDMLSKTLLVLTSDHGQDFWDHYPQHSCYHSHSLYDELLHVPLIAHLPGSTTKGRVIENQVRSVDILPTILSALSIEYDASAVDGTTLLPLIHDATSLPELVAYGEDTHCGPERKSVRTRRYKYVYVPDLTQVRDGMTGIDFYHRGIPVLAPIAQEELYDLERDPGETQNLVASYPKLVAQFRKQVREVFGIPTAQLLKTMDGQERIEIEGAPSGLIEDAVVIVPPTQEQSLSWQASHGNLNMLGDGAGNVGLSFRSPASAELYLVQLTYSRKYDNHVTLQLTVQRPTSSEQAPDVAEESILLKQLKSLGYTR